jgi:hypothetical protein
MLLTLTNALGLESRLPRVLHYDASMHVLVLEDLGPIPTLKAWSAESSTASTSQPFGSVLGCFLASVHKLHLSQPAVLSELGRNQPGRYLSATYYASIAKKYGYHDQFIEQAAAVAHQKVLEGRDILTIGDFWPGNVLVCRNQLCHFIVMAPTVWGRPVEPERMSALLHHGLQLIKAGWERDDDILRSSMLAPLYR